MSPVIQRILPELNDVNRAYWTGGKDNQLLIQRCVECRVWLHPAGIICRHCLSRELAHEPVSGYATVQALTINHQPWTPGQQVPYAVAIVSLDEQKGLNLTTNIIGCPPESAFIGQRVKVAFEAVEDVYLPLFTPL